MANQQKKGEDDGVVTSAPASKVGSLLTDLLNDVKESVAQEQKQIETESDRRAREERETRDREEGRKREAAQQKLIEETRRRNEALAKRERGDGEGRKALATAPHMRPLTEAVPAGPKSAELTVVAPPAKAPSKLMLVALVVIGVGVGLGTSLALTPSPRDAGIDVSGAAKAVIAATRKQATAEGKILMELEASRKQIAELQKSVGEAQGGQKALGEQLAVMKTDSEKMRAELEALKGAAGDKGPRRPATPGNGVPNINSSIFNK